MTAKTKRKSRPVLHALTVLTLLAGSVYFTLELRKDEQAKAPTAQPVVDRPVVKQGDGSDTADTGKESWERLRNPERTVLRSEKGKVLATFTDRARTATLTGPSRTFSEPALVGPKVVTESWVRLMPEPWAKGAEKEKWFKDWFAKFRSSEEDDLFAIAFQYVDKAPSKKDAEGVKYAGDAVFGPINPNGSAAGDYRLEQSDFFDYLGIPYTFRNGKVMQPEKAKIRAMDCSGFIRTVFGYRARYPLAPLDGQGDGLPRTANGMARSKLGADVIPLTSSRPKQIDQLQPGDLVFFEIDKRTGARLDHTGIYMGPDTNGNRVFVSSREEANGPTISDKGGTSRLNGAGFYATGLRSAKRL